MSERRVAVIGAMLVALGPICMAVYTPGMPAIAADLGTTEAMTKLTLTSYFAGFAAAQLVAGPLSDAYGRRWTACLFLAVFVAASVGAMLAGSVEELILFRALQGVGASVGIAVSRAVVRDLFTGEASSRIMNTIAMMLAVGPAIAPTLGGLALEVFAWPALFALMILYGLALLAMVRGWLVETVSRDPARFRPAALARSYAQLALSAHFMTTSVVLMGSIGLFYAQATILPFVLIGEVGLTPTAFGVAMIAQSGSFFLGALATRQLMKSRPADALAAPGLAIMGAASVAISLHAFGLAPSLLSTMGPIAVAAFGIALLLPSMSTSVLAPFPHIAGAASAGAGFMQMAGGLLGGIAAASIGDPTVGLGLVIPGMTAIAMVAFVLHRRLPHAAGAAA